MGELILGPLLRYVSDTEATVWVETSVPCEVEILGRREPTFRVEGHHYALVRLDELEPGSRHEYEVALDGERCWPPEGSELPPSTIRTLGGDGLLTISFGSCRLAVPHEPPFTESMDAEEEGSGVDALWILAKQAAASNLDGRPEQLFLLGDQIYVDEGSPGTRARIRQRRGTATGPDAEVSDFEEYTWLYHESWREPLIRWLFSTVSLSMLWDDHDMSDDWNISRSWLDEVRRFPWWHGRAVGCIMSYWIYQHMGNLSPRELDENDLYPRIRGNQHATEEMRAWAEEIDTTASGTRWSFCRDFGRTRAVFIDARAGRVLEPGGRAILDEEEWSWIVDRTRGDFDHLLVATTVPLLLTPTFHHLEAWNERVCDGAWGRLAARAGERLRRALDFDHWACFQRSFQALSQLLARVARGEHGRRPASVVVLSGDVHHAYLCDVALRGSGAERAPIYQAVCSPYRNPLDEKERSVVRAGFRAAPEPVASTLARLAGAPQPDIRWRMLEGPHFDNQVGTLELRGRSAEIHLDKTVAGRGLDQTLERTFERRLA